MGLTIKRQVYTPPHFTRHVHLPALRDAPCTARASAPTTATEREQRGPSVVGVVLVAALTVFAPQQGLHQGTRGRWFPKGVSRIMRRTEPMCTLWKSLHPSEKLTLVSIKDTIRTEDCHVEIQPGPLLMQFCSHHRRGPFQDYIFWFRLIHHLRTITWATALAQPGISIRIY